MTDTAVAVSEDAFHGRNRISSRAIRAVVSAVTAGELDTTAGSVSVELSDDNGGLAVTVSAPVGVPSLVAPARTARPTSTIAQGTILERALAAQNTIRGRVMELTGSTIGTVNLRLTSARIEGDERVL
jgi:hypothetical protein